MSFTFHKPIPVVCFVLLYHIPPLFSIVLRRPFQCFICLRFKSPWTPTLFSAEKDAPFCSSLTKDRAPRVRCPVFCSTHWRTCRESDAGSWYPARRHHERSELPCRCHQGARKRGVQNSVACVFFCARQGYLTNAVGRLLIRFLLWSMIDCSCITRKKWCFHKRCIGWCSLSHRLYIGFISFCKSSCKFRYVRSLHFQ